MVVCLGFNNGRRCDMGASAAYDKLEIVFIKQQVMQ